MSKRKHDGASDDTEPPAKKRKTDGEGQIQPVQSQEQATVNLPERIIPPPPTTISPDNDVEKEKGVNDSSMEDDDMELVGMDEDNEICSKARKDVENLITRQEDFQKKFLENLGSIVNDFVDDMHNKFQDQQQEAESMMSKVRDVVAKNRDKEEQFGKAKEYAEEIFQKLSIS